MLWRWVWDLKSMISGLVFIVNWIEVTDSNLIQALWDCIVSAKFQVAIFVWIWFWFWISKNLVKPTVRNTAVFWALLSTRQTLLLVGSALVSNFRSNRLALQVLESNPGLRTWDTEASQKKAKWLESILLIPLKVILQSYNCVHYEIQNGVYIILSTKSNLFVKNVILVLVLTTNLSCRLPLKGT